MADNNSLHSTNKATIVIDADGFSIQHDDTVKYCEIHNTFILWIINKLIVKWL
jgi:hypothetical protein